jgi:hypothetical protein
MKPIVMLGLLWAIALLSGCATVVPVPRPGAAGRGGDPLAGYARVLQRFVNERGEVDFPALAADLKDLEIYVGAVGAIRATDIADSNDRLAHYLNSYNALSMYNVVASGIPETHAGYAKVKFFYLRKFLIGGKYLSLYEYENDVIRPLGDPRIHFALNCSALGCPVLPKAPFSGTHVQTELDREARRFLNDERNVKLDIKKRVAHLNQILEFYTTDFLNAETPDLITFVNRYRESPIPADFSEEFMEYDWTIANSRRKRR